MQEIILTKQIPHTIRQFFLTLNLYNTWIIYLIMNYNFKIMIFLANSNRFKALNSALVAMIAIEMTPTTIVEDRGFQKFVSSFDPRKQPPSRKIIAHT